MRRPALQFPLLLALLMTSGCMTHRLWNDANLNQWNEPAPHSNLRLYHDVRRDDLLAVYDEFSERRATNRTRAFFLRQNEKRLAQKTRPHFLDDNSARGLAPVPVLLYAPTNSFESLFAVVNAKGKFTVYSGGHACGSYQLPAYDDGTGRWKRIALTPVSLTLDLTIIGGWLGCLWIYAGGPGVASH
jgi:hypothetical protein